ncbi:hypothetical protein SK128_019910 [Halocaridina rubra]|uniref:MRG domain-containing protein n=1 Tax=Halocaridina rubra TaxID=373956 RepID=A0AAN8XQ76_HALRR
MGSGASDIESNTTAVEEDETAEEGEEEEEEREVDDEAEEESDDETSDEETFEKHFPIVIPDNLKTILEKDYFFVNEKDKVLDLPARRTVLSILESYVRFFAARYMPRTKERRRSEPREKDKTYLT